MNENTYAKFDYDGLTYLIIKDPNNSKRKTIAKSNESIDFRRGEQLEIIKGYLIQQGETNEELMNDSGKYGMATKLYNFLLNHRSETNEINESLIKTITKKETTHNAENLSPCTLTPAEFYNYSLNYLENYARTTNVELNKYFKLTDYDNTWVYKNEYGLNTETTENELNYLFAQFAYHATNKSFCPFYKFTEKVEDRKRVFHNFNINEFLETYNINNIEQSIPLFIDALIKPDSKGINENKIADTRKYIKLMINVATYLRNKGTKHAVIDDIKSHLNAENIRSGIEYATNTIWYSTIADEKLNIGIALVCDTIKEISNDFKYLFKPDLHVKRILGIYYGLDLKTDNDENAYVALEKGVELVESIKESGIEVSGYKVDRMLYLIGSGKFYLDRCNGVHSGNAKKTYLSYLREHR